MTGIEYVRGHGILDDENGVYTEDEHGNAVYNFAYVDQIYEGPAEGGCAPGGRDLLHAEEARVQSRFVASVLVQAQYFAPPKSMERWDALITALGKNLVEHFGADEVAQWYFEVWNEPNIDFWAGIPRDRSYYELYEHTARALKAVSPRLRVGGPATAAADWVADFLAYTNEHKVPVDFVSSHGYADDTIENLFPASQKLPVPTPPAKHAAG